MKVLFLILARHGSIRIPKKNSRAFYQANSLFDIAYEFCRSKDLPAYFEYDLLVSTNDASIQMALESKKNYNYRYERPEYLSGANTSSDASAFHAIQWYMTNVGSFDYCVLMQPTSPLRTFEGFENFMYGVTDITRSYASVSRLKLKRRELVIKSGETFVRAFQSTKQVCNNEDYVFYEDGSYYCSSIHFIEKKGKFLDLGCLSYVLAEEQEQIDIDTVEEFQTARKIYAMRIKTE